MTPYTENPPVAWHISTYSEGASANCVEAGPIRDGSARVAIRDSTRRHAGAFTTGRASWSAFVAWAARRGQSVAGIRDR